MTRLLPLAAGVGWATAVLVQGGTSHRPDPAVPPSVPVALALTANRPTVAASGAWVAAVAAYAEFPEDAAAIQPWVLLAHRLDPSFRAALATGALMAGALGDRAVRDALLERGAEHHPDDPWFLLALAATDRANRRTWLERAASLPGADPAVREAAARLAGDG